MRTWATLLTLGLLSSACGGEIGNRGRPDARGIPADATASDVGGSDLGPLDAGGDSGTSGPDGSLNDGALRDAGVDAGVADTGPVDSGVDLCATVNCPTNASCWAGVCSCNPGFVDDGAGACVPPDAGDPRTRTKPQLCTHWNAEYPTQSTNVYDPGDGVAMCDPGTIDPVAHDDAMRRLNLFRWLVGLEPAGVDWGNQGLCQAAALMMDLADDLDHTPPMSWQCYSQDGSRAAGSSNLALGVRHPAQTVDLYIRENNVPSLGHRRWVLNPSLDDVGFGHYDRGGAMWAFGRTNRTSPDYVAYPPPGVVPDVALLGPWSISSNANLAGAQVTVVRVSDGATIPTTVSQLPQGFAQNTISVALGDSVDVGESYDVTITLSDQTVWSHTTTIVDCSVP